LKITFIIFSLDAGGAERVVSTFANFFSKKHEVDVLIYKDSPSFYELNPQVNLNVIEHKRSVKYPFKRIRNIFFRIWALRKELLYRKSDVYIAFTTTMNLYTIIANLFLNKKIFISERVDPNATQLPPFILLLRNLIYSKADQLIVQNSTQYYYFKQRVNQNKIAIIPNPIVKNNFLNKEDKTTHIVNIGRLADQKNHLDLIDAFTKANLECDLYILGDGPNKTKLMDYIMQINMQNKIHLIGIEKNIYKYLKPNWIFASTSKYEGQPNALLEAMNAGLGCIHYDCPSGMEEIIENNVNGFLIPMGDAELFSIKLKELYVQSNKRESMGLNAKKSVQRFQTENIAKEWYNLF